MTSKFFLQALRALALIRLSRTAEAMAVLAEIEQQDPDEEYTLQALTYCYRDLGRRKLAFIFVFFVAKACVFYFSRKYYHSLRTRHEETSSKRRIFVALDDGLRPSWRVQETKSYRHAVVQTTAVEESVLFLVSYEYCHAGMAWYFSDSYALL